MIQVNIRYLKVIVFQLEPKWHGRVWAVFWWTGLLARHSSWTPGSCGLLHHWSICSGNQACGGEKSGFRKRLHFIFFNNTVVLIRIEYFFVLALLILTSQITGEYFTKKRNFCQGPCHFLPTKFLGKFWQKHQF